MGDDFRIKYYQKEDAQLFLDVRNKYYEDVSESWEGKLVCAIKLEWDYDNCTINLSDSVLDSYEEQEFWID